MDYQVFEPGEELNTFIKCYWTLESAGEEPSPKQTIVPDGCMEMIFHYGDLYLQYTGKGNRLVQPRCFVIGQLTRPLEIEPTGKTGIFSVRFHPEGFLPFATLPIKEMENTAVSLEKLFGSRGLELEQSVLTARETSERITLTEAFLFRQLTETETIDRIIKSTVETLLTANGQISVEELSRKTRINRRQLERKFSLAIGLSPKQLSKILRLQATLQLLLGGKANNLTSLAYEGRYYDQAHFIKDFREFTGLTPKEFYDDQLKMSRFFM
ncbi:MAG: helix-turn-helix domain-containing protein [Leadbetterella sp.]|nr:helix-turn-helix domain-containing protein [Leadbetterella sp.]